MMRTFSLGLSALALALAGGVLTGDAMAAAPRPAPLAAGHDVTRAEAKAGAETLFDALDANHDGKLDKADPEARHQARVNAMFDRLDTNHDGQVSRDEFAAAHPMRGPEGRGPDGERDGPPPPPGGPQRPMHGDMRPDLRDGHVPHGADGPDREDSIGPRGGMMAMAILRQADPGHAGPVSRDAFVAAALQMFDKADTNHDGKLSRDERRAAMDAMRPHHGRDGRDWRHDGPHGPQDRPGDAPPPPAGQ